MTFDAMSPGTLVLIINFELSHPMKCADSQCAHAAVVTGRTCCRVKNAADILNARKTVSLWIMFGSISGLLSSVQCQDTALKQLDNPAMIGNMKIDIFFGHLCPSVRDLIWSNAEYLRHDGGNGYRRCSILQYQT